ncbi:MAG: 4Fe-4S binding protein, partial [Bacillota bacterium]|nr:4Fe-4S binding protein [Bacillota bacterium]
MKEENKELFKALVKAYDDGTFKEVINNMLKESDDKDSLMALISTLSGIDSVIDINFVDILEKKIKNYKSGKVVNKIVSCPEGCKSENKERSCSASCPFNAIFYDADEKNIKIAEDACIDCGICVEACPENTILDKVEFLPLLNKLRSGDKVIAAIAPAIAGQFGDKAALGRLRTSLKKLGFFDMVEVAFFADMLTLKEA